MGPSDRRDVLKIIADALEVFSAMGDARRQPLESGRRKVADKTFFVDPEPIKVGSRLLVEGNSHIEPHAQLSFRIARE